MAERKGLKRTIAATIGIPLGFAAYALSHPKITFGDQTSNQSDRNTSVAGTFRESPTWTITPSLTPSATPTPSVILQVEPTADVNDAFATSSFETIAAEMSETANPNQLTPAREIPNPDMGDAYTETATEAPTQTPTTQETSPAVFTFYETSADAVGDNPVEINSIIPGGITTAEDGHILDFKSITLATFVINGTGYGLKDEDLHRLATSHAFLETQYGITGKVNTDSFRIYSGAPSQTFDINGINFITNSDSYARGFGVDEKGRTTSVEIYQTESENSYIDEVAVDDNTGIAFVVRGSDVREHGFITYVITDADGKVTRVSVDKMCGNVVGENGTMNVPTPGATVTLQNTPISFMSETPTPYFTPFETITPHHSTPTPILTLTDIPTQPATETKRPPTDVPTQPPSTEVPATHVPPTDVPPTSVPPTEVKPTAGPPTDIPTQPASAVLLPIPVLLRSKIKDIMRTTNKKNV